MKFYKFLFIILIIFFKTGNVLSNNNIFSVNNIELIKKDFNSNQQLADQAIINGFNQLIEKILLKKDIIKLKSLNLEDIKELVLYYRIISKEDDNYKNDFINFNIFFDREKIYNLFLKNEISYSEIFNKEIYILPIFKKEDKINVYNQNILYERWNNINEDLIEFILPLENIEVLENINTHKNELLNLELNNIFLEYPDKNLALVIYEETKSKREKIFLKLKILDKKINKSIIVSKLDDQNKFYENIISSVKAEIINIVKSQHLVDISRPSFLNAKFILSSKNNLKELKNRLKEITLIENIFVQELNNEYIYLKIKYLGKLDKIIKQLKIKNINLELFGEEWNIGII